VSDDDTSARKGGGGSAPPPRSRRRNGRAASDKAFDIWLDRSLHTLFDDVAKEPIPPDLLRLIEQDRKR
jgi:hypothetical protein